MTVSQIIKQLLQFDADAEVRFYFDKKTLEIDCFTHNSRFDQLYADIDLIDTYDENH